MDKEFTCSVCKKTKTPQTNSCGTVYATNDKKEKICYDCCGVIDTEAMKDSTHGDKFTLYLTKEYLSEDKLSYRHCVANWPGTLKFNCHSRSEGRHNIAGTRTDVWFGNNEIGNWWGVSYGDNTQIVHCTKLKD